jgi:hypothetical protein
MFAAIGVQPSLDFQQRDIGLTANEAEQIVAMRFDPVRPLIPPVGAREISPVAVKRQTQRTALAILGTIGLPGCFSHGNQNAGAVDYQRVPRNGG